MAASIVQRSVRLLVGEDNDSVARFLPLEIVGAHTVWKHPSRELNDNVVQRRRAVTENCSCKI